MKNMIKPKITVEMTSKPSILSNLALRTDFGGSKLSGRSPGG
jgi:hypothetical protein